MSRVIADTTGQVVVVVLIVVVDIAIVHIDNPGVVGIVGIGSRRPIIVGLRFIFFTIKASVNSINRLFSKLIVYSCLALSVFNSERKNVFLSHSCKALWRFNSGDYLIFSNIYSSSLFEV